MLPCNSINSDLGLMQGENGIVSPDCVPDLEAQESYVGAGNILIYSNYVRFMHERYGDERLRRYSSILNKQFDVKHPSWLNTEV